MMSKILRNLWIIRSLFPSLIFCLYHLPFCKAIKLPILIYKAKIQTLFTGKIVINSDVHFGMIQLGRNKIPLLPNTGINIDNKGEIIFKGRCFIGNASAISVGKTGSLILGENTYATAGLKIVCYHSIIIEDNVLIGWDNTIMDTDLHKIYYKNSLPSKGFNSVRIQHDTWIGMGCTILKGIDIPQHSVIASNSVLRKLPKGLSSYNLFGNRLETHILKEDTYWDINDDRIEYE